MGLGAMSAGAGQTHDNETPVAYDYNETLRSIFVVTITGIDRTLVFYML